MMQIVQIIPKVYKWIAIQKQHHALTASDEPIKDEWLVKLRKL